MYISGGENVYPAEVESVLMAHPDIREIAIIGVPDPKWGEVGCAVVATISGEPLSVEAIHQQCEGNWRGLSGRSRLHTLTRYPGTAPARCRNSFCDRNTPEPASPNCSATQP